MRVQESFVDYNHVHPEHEAIHARLENWRRWVTVRPHGWQTALCFVCISQKGYWHVLSFRTLLTPWTPRKIERAVSRLPIKNRRQIRWCYGSQANRFGMARRLAVSRWVV